MNLHDDEPTERFLDFGLIAAAMAATFARGLSRSMPAAPKSPEERTDADRDRLARAEAKRQRKNAKRRKQP